MSRVPLGRKQQTHGKILASAGKLLRRDGLRGASVAKVMADAGLTVGGFYAHFKSWEAMVEESFSVAMKSTTDWVVNSVASLGSGKERYLSFLETYLSPAHRDIDRQGGGCPAAAMAAELAKGPPGAQKAFSRSFEEALRVRMASFSDASHRLEREEFIAATCTYIGGLILARASRGTPLSAEILAACRKHLRLRR